MGGVPQVPEGRAQSERLQFSRKNEAGGLSLMERNHHRVAKRRGSFLFEFDSFRAALA